MTLFKRHIWDDLLNWKNQTNRKPLILRGARQVGKTSILRSLGSTFAHYIELNLEKYEHKKLFEQCRNIKQLITSLSLINKLPSSEFADTLLFIDEIQESPEAISLLRYFYEEFPEIAVVAAGSLLEHSFKNIQHFPVGRVNYMYLFPLNFQEFLLATNNEMLLERLHTIPIDDVSHNILLDEFHTYCIIGGMPEVVAQYAEYKDITKLLTVYESIWNTYKDDVVKYAHNRTEERIIKHIMDTAAASVDKRIKFQNFGNSAYKSREVGEAFRNLDKAKVIQIIYPSTQIEPPILSDYKKSPRIQMLDTGLLNFDLDIQAQLLSMQDLSKAYHGAIIPHLITQEILSLQKTSYKKPNFWVRNKTQSVSEVDLLQISNGLVIPIEIKSGTSGTLKSLHQFIDSAPHKFAVRMYAGKFNIEESTTRSGKKFYLMNLPYYTATLLKEYLDYFIKIKSGRIKS